MQVRPCNHTVQYLSITGLLCEEDEFQCPIGGPCVPLSFLCDDVTHCSDGFDELNCSSENNLYCYYNRRKSEIQAL